MEQQILISVIIPVFNTGERLKTCVNSVLNQSLSSIEIILVDDGSFDGTEILCDDYAGIDNRIVVVHKKNGGASSARNAGLDIAKYEYIVFVYSDDFIDNYYLDFLYSEIKYSDVEFVRLTCYRGINKLNYRLNFDENHRCLLNTHSLRNFSTLIFVWGCLIKKSIIGTIRFNEKIHYNEDKLFIISVFLNVRERKFIALDRPLYHQIIREGSLSNSGITANRLTVFSAVEKIIEACQNDPKLLCLEKKNKRASYYSLLREIILNKEYKKNILLVKQMKKEIKKLRHDGYKSENKKEDFNELLFTYINSKVLILFYFVMRKIHKIYRIVFNHRSLACQK